MPFFRKPIHLRPCPPLGEKRRDSRWIGSFGEKIAASWCKSSGWNILRRNWKFKDKGEIDLVCRDGNCLVFAEVKTRTGTAFGNPARAVDRNKRRLIRSGGREWLRLLDDKTVQYRYDIIEIILTPGDIPRINHIPYAFGEKESGPS